MTARLQVVVNGTPAPQGSKRHVGGGRMVESSKAVGPWREAVRAETQRAIEAGGPTFLGPVSVTLRFGMPRPKAHFRTNGELRPAAPPYPAGRPDLDKLARAVLDGITAGGAVADDALIVHLFAHKLYAPVAGVTVLIEDAP